MSVGFSSVEVDFSDAEVNDDGSVTVESAAFFPGTVVSAGAAIQSFSLSFGDGDSKVGSIGAEISDVTPLGMQVTFSATLRLADEDADNILDGGDVEMTVLVIAGLG